MTFFAPLDRKSTRLNSSHLVISYAVFCLKKKKKTKHKRSRHPQSQPHSHTYDIVRCCATVSFSRVLLLFHRSISFWCFFFFFFFLNNGAPPEFSPFPPPAPLPI